MTTIYSFSNGYIRHDDMHEEFTKNKSSQTLSPDLNPTEHLQDVVEWENHIMLTNPPQLYNAIMPT